MSPEAGDPETSHHKPGTRGSKKLQGHSNEENPSLWYAKLSNTSPSEAPLLGLPGASHKLQPKNVRGSAYAYADSMHGAGCITQPKSIYDFTSSPHVRLVPRVLGSDTDEVILCPSCYSIPHNSDARDLPFLPLLP